MTERTDQEAQRKREKRRARKLLWPLVIVLVVLFGLPDWVSVPRQIAFTACGLIIVAALLTEYAIRRIKGED
jgi:cobalamin synthase